MHVVVLFGEGDPTATTRAVLGERTLAEELSTALGPHRMTTISTTDANGPGRVIVVDASGSRRQRLLDALGGATIVRLLRGSAPGRLILSLSPLAPSRIFRRAVAANKSAAEAVATADVLIAADLAATSLAWHAQRRRPQQRALWGLDRALRLLRVPLTPGSGTARV